MNWFWELHLFWKVLCVWGSVLLTLILLGTAASFGRPRVKSE